MEIIKNQEFSLNGWLSPHNANGEIRQTKQFSKKDAIDLKCPFLFDIWEFCQCPRLENHLGKS